MISDFRFKSWIHFELAFVESWVFDLQQKELSPNSGHL